jgi:protein SCO1/2
MPVATLTDQDGHRATIASGRVTLLYFGYTSCPDVCPTTMADIAAGLRKAGPGVAAKVRVVMVSSDPVRDTPAALKQWLGGYDPSFEGLTGDWATITRAARTVGVLLPETQPVALTDVGHSAQVIGYTADGAGRVMWLGSATPGQLAAQIAHDVPLLVAGRG